MEDSKPQAVGARLSVMMFLQFFTWGAWYVTMSAFITKEESVVQWPAGVSPEWINGWAYSVAPIAAIIAPLFLGIVADRYFSSERVLGVLMLIGAAFIGLAPTFAVAETPLPFMFLACLLAHTLCFMPTLGLTNTIAFTNTTNQEKQFPLIRVFGTIGWIVAGLFISLVLDADLQTTPFYVASAASVVLGIYAFTLPHTPPPAAGTKPTLGQLIGVDAIKMMRDKNFAVFMICSLLICIPLAAYYAKAATYIGDSGFTNIAGTMSFGQMSEVFFMLVMPLFFARLGVKWMLAAGMLAWVVRYGLFALGAPESVSWMIIVGIALHGICYDFFFVTGQIYVDKKAPTQLRGQAQGFLVLMTQGVGLLIGAQLTGLVAAKYTTDAGSDWETIWFYPAVAAAVILVIFVVLFREKLADSNGATDDVEVAHAAGREELV